MNRKEKIRQALIWDAAGRRAYARAARWREQLATEARAELAEQETAPTWRHADLATVTLPVSQEAAYVADPQKWLEWVKANHPDKVQTVEQVVPKFQAEVLQSYLIDSESGVVHDGEGTVVSGLGVRTGGLPLTLTFTPARAAKQALGEAADKVLDMVAASLHLPPPPEPVEAAGEVAGDGAEA